jgi:hypothetical protein
VAGADIGFVAEHVADALRSKMAMVGKRKADLPQPQGDIHGN